MTTCRKMIIGLLILLCFTAVAIAQCQISYGNCWHCVRSTCWSSAGQVGVYGSLYSWTCRLAGTGICGAGECNLHDLYLTGLCDGYFYYDWGSICCDIA